jgi:hypothetical protein
MRWDGRSDLGKLRGSMSSRTSRVLDKRSVTGASGAAQDESAARPSAMSLEGREHVRGVTLNPRAKLKAATIAERARKILRTIFFVLCCWVSFVICCFVNGSWDISLIVMRFHIEEAAKEFRKWISAWKKYRTFMPSNQRAQILRIKKNRQYPYGVLYYFQLIKLFDHFTWISIITMSCIILPSTHSCEKM